ncbi:MAG: MBOAT family O-acyltransferase [Thermoanaerobaculia bacterium]
MVFSSHVFVYGFLPIALAVYYLLPRSLKHLGLTVLSYLFYGWSNPAFMVLMLTSTAIDYVCGLSISKAGFGRDPIEPLPPVGHGRGRGQKVAVTISILSNLTLLGVFKYFNFAVDNYNAVVAWLGMSDVALDSVLRVVLPLGISFYTFQSMSYSIDVYRGHAPALRNPIDFACYVSMFPQLVAGPIIRFSEIHDQLRSRAHSIEKFARGVAFVSLGMAKKIVLANPCGKIADTTFDAASVLPLDAWYGAVAYAFQIYFDFSAYSDLAIGLGLMLGFVFPKNFDSPYKSASITEFWRRWHISLSTWLRDYLYKPLGGNRRGSGRTYVNLALVMLLGGLWHGAAWNFVAWGAFHGALLALERARGKRAIFDRLPHPGRVAATFALVLVSWVFFRAADLGSAFAYLAAMFGALPDGAGADGAWLLGGLIYRPYYIISFTAAAVIAFSAPQTWDWTRRLQPWKAVVCLALLWTSLVLLMSQAYNPFIYFIF